MPPKPLPKDHLARFATAHWIGPLGRYCLPHAQIGLSRGNLARISALAAGRRPAGAFSAALREDLEASLAGFPAGAHLRLEGCSLRARGQVPRIADAREALQALALSNARVAACQRQLQGHLAEQALYLFAWADVPIWSEFRVLIAARRLLGITQYHPDRSHAQIVDAAPALRASLMRATAVLLDTVAEDSFAADLFVDGAGVPRLIELNPLGATTSLGLYAGRDFDGGFRYVLPSARAVARPEADCWET